MDKLLDLPSYFENGLKKNEDWEVGIDEAGRGPVLGPMVYGCCYWPVKLKEDLAKIGFADSKALNEEERDKYFSQIKELNQRYLGYEVKILDPEYISNRMLQKDKYSLNKISYDSAIGLIETVLNKGINVVQCYLDAVGVVEAYTELLQNYFRVVHPKVKFTVSEKAESKFPVVAAASICAKVTRDETLKEWKFRENVNGANFNFGSGYPGDEKTVSWLKQHRDAIFGFPDLVRFSWKTCEVLIGEKVLVEYEDPAETRDKNCNLDNFVAGEKKGFHMKRLGVNNQFVL